MPLVGICWTQCAEVIQYLSHRNFVTYIIMCMGGIAVFGWMKSTNNMYAHMYVMLV